MPRRSYSDKMEQLRWDWGGDCVWSNGTICGGPLEFAHLPGKETGLEGKGRGMPQRYHDIKKHPDCYVLLCREHHTELDSRGGRGSNEYGRLKKKEEKPLCRG